jgi:L-alanine-DL-glutamate epimerase-like enolase superfamily enzyme
MLKAAIDIAAHDALGKILNRSVSSLLGGAKHQIVPSYYATGVGSPDEIIKIVKEKINEGYPRLQIKVGGRPIEVDIEVIKKVGELIKGKGIRMAADANRGWTTRDAIRASRECLEVPFVMEQPCDTIEDLIKIRPQVSHPIYMDENSTSLNTVISVVGRGIVDGFGMKITRIGGLQPMKTFRDICESANLPHTCDDSWGGDIIAAACTQVAATVKENLLEGVWLAAPYIEGHYDEKNGVQINKGHISVSQKPGLGIEIDEKKFSAPIFSY